jgi:DNA-binding transcriptional regulator GbsR (MarR family)
VKLLEEGFVSESQTGIPRLAGQQHPAGDAVAAMPTRAAGEADGRAPDSAATDGRAADSGAIDGRDPASVRHFIESFTAHLMQAGFPRTPARIFVALLTSDSSSLTAAELADLLQTSPASVSSGARYLVHVGLVTAYGEPGSRRQHYRMPVSVWQDIVRLRDQQFSRWAAELSNGVQVLGPSSPAGQRMADTVRYFQFISSEMQGLLARWAEQSGR